MTKEVQTVPRDSAGKWLPGAVPNPNGRPKGSKNRITTLKLLAEELVRENHTDLMLQVIEEIINSALKGDKTARKLVWSAIMSKGATDSEKGGKERVEIKIGRVDNGPTPVTIEGHVTDEDEDNAE